MTEAEYNATPHPYGYVNGKPVYSRDEFVFAKRHFGPIESDEELVKYAEKVTHGWYDAGWKRSFISFYLSDYALSSPRQDLTKREFERLQELQQIARDEYNKAEAAKGWTLFETNYYADNSVEEVYRSKDGEEKIVMTVAPHGDIC